jgi:hypothetical protein
LLHSISEHAAKVRESFDKHYRFYLILRETISNVTVSLKEKLQQWENCEPSQKEAVFNQLEEEFEKKKYVSESAVNEDQ